MDTLLNCINLHCKVIGQKKLIFVCITICSLTSFVLLFSSEDESGGCRRERCLSRYERRKGIHVGVQGDIRSQHSTTGQMVQGNRGWLYAGGRGTSCPSFERRNSEDTRCSE